MYSIAQLDEPKELNLIVLEILKTVEQRIRTMREDSIAIIFWSLAAMNILTHHRKLVITLVQKLLVFDFDANVVAKFQTYQGLLSLSFSNDKDLFEKLNMENVNQKIQQLNTDLNLIAKIRSERILSPILRDSSFDFVKVLSVLNLTAIPEFVVGGYSIDIAIVGIDQNTFQNCRKRVMELDMDIWNQPWRFVKERDIDFEGHTKNKNSCLFIEINGPDHYVGQTNNLRGSTHMKLGHLTKMGYNVKSFSKKECILIASKTPEMTQEKLLFFLDILEKEYHKPSQKVMRPNS